MAETLTPMRSRATKLLFLAGTLSVALTATASGQVPVLDGLWKSQSGAVYRLVQRGNAVVVTYEIPNVAQEAAGIVKGDLALKGDFIAGVLTGTYYQRAPLAVQEACPEFKIIDGPVQWELKDGSLTGALMLIGGSDENCAVTVRSLSQMRMERLPDPSSAEIAMPAKTMPSPWPVPW